MVSVHDISTFSRKGVEYIAPGRIDFCRGFFCALADSNDLAKFRTILYYAKVFKKAYHERLEGGLVGKCE